MCGIAGIYSMNGSPLKDPISRIKRMLNIQYNRGPDACGFSFSEDKRLILGNTRLSIVDINTNLPLPFNKTGSKKAYRPNKITKSPKEFRKYETWKPK